jgi:nucleotide-binding universal stress UspA family protein
MQVRTILWPTDLSGPSLGTATQLRGLAGTLGARIVLLHVTVDPDQFFPAYGHGSQPQQTVHDMRFRVWEREEARQRLERICHEQLTGCGELEIRIEQGDPAERILAAAAGGQVDLVVLTARAQRGQNERSVRTRGVIERVLDGSPAPVLVIKAPAQ